MVYLSYDSVVLILTIIFIGAAFLLIPISEDDKFSLFLVQVIYLLAGLALLSLWCRYNFSPIVILFAFILLWNLYDFAK